MLKIHGGEWSHCFAFVVCPLGEPIACQCVGPGTCETNGLNYVRCNCDNGHSSELHCTGSINIIPVA